MACTAPILAAESGLARYLEEIRRFPVLERQEEYRLAKRWREHGDRKAMHRVVASHLRLVAKIATGYRGYGLPIAEVISEGNVGLVRAAERLVKMGTTANQKKLFFNLRKAKAKISALNEDDMRPDQVQRIAERLGVSKQDVICMNRRLSGDISLNAPRCKDGESSEWQDWLVDECPDQETTFVASEEFDSRHEALSKAITMLGARERRVFQARRLAEEPSTLKELAEEFSVSSERVRQIEKGAFEKVQKAVKTAFAWQEPTLRSTHEQRSCPERGPIRDLH
jgi:RNA polymerase sigma-32 factor